MLLWKYLIRLFLFDGYPTLVRILNKPFIFAKSNIRCSCAKMDFSKMFAEVRLNK